MSRTIAYDDLPEECKTCPTRLQYETVIKLLEKGEPPPEDMMVFDLVKLTFETVEKLKQLQIQLKAVETEYRRGLKLK